MNIEDEVKSKLASPVCPKTMELKQKWYMDNGNS